MGKDNGLTKNNYTVEDFIMVKDLGTVSERMVLKATVENGKKENFMVKES